MKPQNLKDLTRLIKLLRKNNINSIKIDDFALSFSDSAFVAKKRRASVAAQIEEQTEDDLKNKPVFSEEDTLFWSSTAPELPEELEQ